MGLGPGKLVISLLNGIACASTLSKKTARPWSGHGYMEKNAPLPASDSATDPKRED